MSTVAGTFEVPYSIFHINLHSRPFYLITFGLLYYLLLEHLYLRSISIYQFMWKH